MSEIPQTVVQSIIYDNFGRSIDDDVREKVIEAIKDAARYVSVSQCREEDIAVSIEREECAKVCEERHANGNWKYDTREECAAAIRARGES